LLLVTYNPRVTANRPIQPDGKLHGVVAAIHRPADDRWLLVRRSATVAAPLKVCFPGGGVEIGESIEAAVVREMREELGVLIRPLKHCWTWDAPDRPLKLFGWIAELTDGQLRPDPAEIAEVLWLTADEAINHPDALTSNRSFVQCLMDEKRET
jgi:8-oxo-dGTP pyrophosphatase MutT (NUDIX family)